VTKSVRNIQNWIEPITATLGDIPIGSNQDVSVDLSGLSVCNGFIVLSPTGSVKISINGCPLQSIPTTMQLSGAYVQTLRVVTADTGGFLGIGVTTSGCIIQPFGYLS
jgi:hypothetical protein